MNKKQIFKTLFGIEPESIKETCVITPVFSKEIASELGIKNIFRGLLYSVGNNDNFSLVTTRMGAGFVGDAVLHLGNTKCKNLIFFGACCSTKETVKIGSIVLVEKAFSQDSFVNMLFSRKFEDTFYPDKGLLNDVEIASPRPESFRGKARNDTSPVIARSSATKQSNLTKANCLSVASLKLEEQYIKTFGDPDIDVIDMETSAFLAAANSIGKGAAAILFVTDNLGSYPYYVAFSKQNIGKLKKTVQKASKTLIGLMKTM